MARTKSVEHKSNLLQMIPVNRHRISQQSKWPVFLKLGFFFFLMHSCLLSCSVLFLFLAVLGLNFGLWDLVPWSRIKLRPLALGAQSPIPWTKVTPKIKVLNQVIMLAGLSGSADHRGSLKLFVHVQESLGSSIHSGNLQSCLQHGNQNQTWFLSQTAFSWLRSRMKKKKKILCPVCCPTSLDPEMWNEGSDRK